MAVSSNGWAVNPPRTRRLVPGTADVRLTVADGPAGDVLMHVAEQFDRRVEDLDLDSTRGELDDWGHADRQIRGGVTASNHASATAVDFNATRHPLSARGTFTRAQVAEIRRILAEVGGVVRWGGDYQKRADEMHFEINADYAAVAQVADKLKRRAVTPAPVVEEKEDDMSMTLMQGDSKQQVPGKPYTYGDVTCIVRVIAEEGQPVQIRRWYLPGGPAADALIQAHGVKKVKQKSFDGIPFAKGGDMPPGTV